MKEKTAKGFQERLTNEEAFAQRVRDCRTQEEFKALVEAEGYVYEGLESYGPPPEISDDELDSVTGGWGIIRPAEEKKDITI